VTFNLDTCYKRKNSNIARFWNWR